MAEPATLADGLRAGPRPTPDGRVDGADAGGDVGYRDAGGSLVLPGRLASDRR